MKVRKLNAGDLHTVGNMVRKVLPELKRLNAARQADEAEGEHTVRVGKDILFMLMEKCYDDFWKWLASMAGLTVDEFNLLDMDAPVEVITAIAEGGQLQDFLKRLSAIKGLK